MIVPSIDLMNGKAVQLVRGRTLAIDGGDPQQWAEEFALAGELAVIDLDAALGKGNGDNTNKRIIDQLIRRYPCRVGGGIRTVDDAIAWLDRGATKVIIGTAATPELLSQLPRDRIIAALDCENQEIVVEGWQTRTGKLVTEELLKLAPYVGGFLVTFVEREGAMQGGDLELATHLAAIKPGNCRLTVAGGVHTTSEIAALDQLQVDCQLGMALYSRRLNLADALLAPLISRQSKDGGATLWPTVIVDQAGIALGLVWSSLESVRLAVHERRGIYHSRSRGLWRKGETSGATQELIRVDLDCDRDTLRFVVRQTGPGFCHLGRRSCWGGSSGLSALEEIYLERQSRPLNGSYIKRLLETPELVSAKLLEEAGELERAQTREDIIGEAADLLFFIMAKLRAGGVNLSEVTHELDLRQRKVTRRGGEAKPEIV